MTATHLLTAEDLWNLPENGGHNELFAGELCPMSPANTRHGIIALKVGAAILSFVEAKKLGAVTAAETGFWVSRNPDTVLAPDAAFIAASRIPPGGLAERFFEGSPDLAVEVLSPNDSREQTEAKALAYLNAGTRLIWVISPRTRSVTVYRPGPNVQILTENQTLTGEDVLPGFSLPIAGIFA